MPTMPRPNNKAAKIVWNIIGKPAPLDFKRSKEQQKVNKELNYQESARSR